MVSPPYYLKIPVLTSVLTVSHCSLTGTAHCANMYPDAQNDPPQLVEARKKIDQLITQWLAS